MEINKEIVTLGNKFGYEIAINELKFFLESQYQSIDAIKNTARQLLITASLIIGLFGLLQVLYAKISFENLIIYNFIIVITIILYTILISICVFVLSVIEIHTPIRVDWDTLHSAFILKNDEKDILSVQLNAYLSAIELNRSIIRNRMIMVNIASFILPIIVILIFSLSLIS